MLPDNHEIAQFAENGEPVSALSSGNEVAGIIDGFIKQLF